MSEFGKVEAGQDWGAEGREHQPIAGAAPQRASEVLGPRGMAAMRGPAQEDEARPEPNFARAEQPIKDFLSKYYGPDSDAVQRQYPARSVDLTDPRHTDIEAIISGDYLVRSITVLPELNHVVCFVGQTEFHFSGPAAEEIIAAIRR